MASSSRRVNGARGGTRKAATWRPAEGGPRVGRRGLILPDRNASPRVYHRQTALVQRLFNQFLHRPASASEVAAFAALPGSLTLQTTATLVGSQEYDNRINAGFYASYVSALYRDLLGRN